MSTEIGPQDRTASYRLYIISDVKGKEYKYGNRNAKIGRLAVVYISSLM